MLHYHLVVITLESCKMAATFTVMNKILSKFWLETFNWYSANNDKGFDVRVTVCRGVLLKENSKGRCAVVS